jgi:zinc and cadmium transporter
VGWLFLAGMIGFVALERALRWRHPHQLHGDAQHRGPVEHETAVMLLWGDALHNLIDGLVIGASFAVSPEMGLVSTLAVFAHEVPQEVGDFAILLSSGMPKRRAVVLNYLSAVTPIPGAVAAYLWSSASAGAVPWLLPIAAGGFVYIALANLVPALHHRRGAWVGMRQMALIGLGVATIWAIGILHGA